jgi:hypothetical protein
MHTTNYTDTFIEVSADCPAEAGTVPPVKGDARTVANLQFDMISAHPYAFTSDDVLFSVYAQRNDLTPAEHEQARTDFFSKGQACLRASPLTKRYGWGVHCDHNGRIALYGRETAEYKKLSTDKKLKVVKGMRSQRGKSE